LRASWRACGLAMQAGAPGTPFAQSVVGGGVGGWSAAQLRQAARHTAPKNRQRCMAKIVSGIRTKTGAILAGVALSCRSHPRWTLRIVAEEVRVSPAGTWRTEGALDHS
jgi:hypothetical protein